MRIQDGESGYNAKVDTYGRVAGYTVGIKEGNFIALKEENAFAITTDFLTLNSINTEHTALWIRNDHPKLKMFFACISVSWNGGNTSGDKVLKKRTYRNPLIPTANFDEILSYNINFGTFQSPQCLVYQWDGINDGMDIDLSSQNSFCNEIVSKGTTKLTDENSIILDNKNSILLSLEAEEIGLCTITMKFYFNDKHI